MNLIAAVSMVVFGLRNAIRPSDLLRLFGVEDPNTLARVDTLITLLEGKDNMLIWVEVNALFAKLREEGLI